MINLLVIPSDTCGVGYFRSRNPHTMMGKMYPNLFNVDIDFNAPKVADINYYGKYDMIHFHKCLDGDGQLVRWLQSLGKVVVCDVDDYWDLGKYHPMSISAKEEHWEVPILSNISASDYVTTTTRLFREKILPYNKNVFVIPNAIDVLDEQFKPKPVESKRLRFGIICGSAHLEDIKELSNLLITIPQNYRDKMQLVLCGFDVRGTKTTLNKTNGIKETSDIKPEESVWFTYENIITNKHKVISPEYSEYLMKTISGCPETEFEGIENEPFRRVWSKPINHYAEHYNIIDVLLAPLKPCPFNYVKSQLKVIESGFMGKTIIASEYGPYTLDLKTMFDKKHKIHEDGNSILIPTNGGIKPWVEAIKFFIDNPDMLQKAKENLYNTVNGTYDIISATKRRAEIYVQMLKEKGKENLLNF